MSDNLWKEFKLSVARTWLLPFVVITSNAGFNLWSGLGIMPMILIAAGLFAVYLVALFISSRWLDKQKGLDLRDGLW